MTVSAIDESAIPTLHGGKVAIVKSKWYATLVNNMAKECSRVLREHGVHSVIEHDLPGTLEMPLAVSVLAGHDFYDAFVCLSVVEKGDTAHFDLITQATTQALQQVSIERNVPVINEIIAVYNIADAEARASMDENNKGIEGAAAAIEMIRFMRKNSRIAD